MIRTFAAILLTALCGIAAAAEGENGWGRHKQLYAVPTPGPVVIDGKLDDWDLSAQMESFVAEASRASQNAKFALMFDADALYLSGDVTDSSPLMNRRNPDLDPGQGWNGDSCQFRIGLDPRSEYPVQESTWKYKGANAVEDTRDDLIHMTLWHYTDTGKPQLALTRGMSYRPLPLAPNGLALPGGFEARYAQRPDGSGYTFEYRIPWETLGAVTPPKGGDAVAGTVQFNWSRPDGQAIAGLSAVTYDVLVGAGFPYQNASTWGRIHFSATNNVDRALVEAGIPKAKPLPLEFPYELPEDAECTLQLFNADNENVRILVPQQARLAGRNLERWNGCDDEGRPLPPGTYRWRGIYHAPVKAEYRFSVHNDGVPPYPTDDGRGAWGGDHGTPQAALALDDGLILAWDVSEYGWGIIRTDLNGRKRWGSRYNATHLASDGKTLFFAGGHGFHTSPAIRAMNVADALPVMVGGHPEIPAPPGDDDLADVAVTGLACRDSVLYAAYAARNLIARFAADDARLLGTWTVPAPGRLAALADGRLLAVSGDGVVLLRDGAVAMLLPAEHLDAPVAVAADSGKLYVANRGARQDVAVFDLEGRHLRDIGRRGGRPVVGRFDPSGFMNPGGIAVDKNGLLWVPEVADAPKRISVWETATGTFKRDFLGASAYFAYGVVTPDRPDEMIAQGMLWKIDWKALKAEPVATHWRATNPDMLPPTDCDSYAGSRPFRPVIAADGRRFLVGGTRHGAMLYYRDGDLFKPFFGAIIVGYDYIGPPPIALLKDRERFPAGVYLWRDANDDQSVQADELTHNPPHTRFDFLWLYPDLKLLMGDGRLLTPVENEPGRPPRYDLTQPGEKTALSGARWQFVRPDGEGGFYTLYNHADASGPALVRWNADRQKEWSYRGITPWQDALKLPLVGPGRFWGTSNIMGIGGDFVVFQNYFGINHIFRKDGVYVGALLRDTRAGGRGADEGQPEGQGGWFVKLRPDAGGPERYFAIGGGGDVRVWEVTGLDTIRDLPGGIYVHTPEAAEKAQDALREDSDRATAAPPVLARDAADAQPAERALEEGSGFRCPLTFDDENLYLDALIRSAAPFVNGFPDPQLLFKGGNAIDLQLVNDRDEAVRLLVTRRGNKPFGQLYIPKVKDFDGTPTVFRSPTGQESFDRIETVEGLSLTLGEADHQAFAVRLVVPLAALGYTPKPGTPVKMDLGYIFGNANGTKAARRAYLFNDSFSANVLNDIPHESRLEPDRWGSVEVK